MHSNTIKYFLELTQIPRESGNEKEVANYICNFAEKNKLEYQKDSYNNVIIKKKTNKNEPIILQTHLDMVCEKEKDYDFDFKKDKIKTYEENGYIKSYKTTLGADNGIGVAEVLNILENTDYNIEAIFTTSEETSMSGAENIDVSSLQGKMMINLDGFEKSTIILESAAFFDIVIKTNLKKEETIEENIFKIELSGLLGGHSGADIDKNRGNSIKLIANFLLKIKDIKLISFQGGTKFNVIPSTAFAKISTKLSKEELESLTFDFVKENKKYSKNLKLTISNENENEKSLSNSSSITFLRLIDKLKNGVHNKNNNYPTTSINLGVVDLDDNVFKIGMRSSKKEEEKKVIQYLKDFSDGFSYKLEIISSQPGFETDENSPLIKLLASSHKNILHKKPLIKPIHATVEAGFFKDKIKGLSVAIISPEIIGAHTINEMVNIKSTEETDAWLLDFLKRISS